MNFLFDIYQKEYNITLFHFPAFFFLLLAISKFHPLTQVFCAVCILHTIRTWILKDEKRAVGTYLNIAPFRIFILTYRINTQATLFILRRANVQRKTESSRHVDINCMGPTVGTFYCTSSSSLLRL